MKENTSHLLRQIVELGNGEVFYSFVNTMGKTWLMPAKNIRTAMAFYQPGSRKGKILKMFIPYLSRIPFFGRLKFCKSMRLSVSPALGKLLEDTFGCTSPELSLFCGTPSINQKITIQISQGKKILGYCKLTDKPKTAALFSSEESVLKELRCKGIDRVPQCLYCGRLSDDVFVFAQSTDRTENVFICHRFTDYHRIFLNKLYTVTKECFLFEETDFARSLKSLGEYADGFPAKDRELLRNAVNAIKDIYRDETVEFSMYHGDFTPWNTFVVDEELFAFDFEYACRSCPPYMDACHFISETARLELKLEPMKAFRFFCQNISHFLSELKTPEYLYLSYLLYTLSFYFRLYNGRFDTDDKGYAYWIGLIRIITDKTNGNKTK